MDTISEHFDEEWENCLDIVVLSDNILKKVRGLIEKHPLRGFDALHLASALLIKERVKEELVFVCSDRNLLEAAGEERFKILNLEIQFS